MLQSACGLAPDGPVNKLTGTLSMQKNNYGFERIAHRGASTEAPENTIPAIELAVQKHRVDRVEVDVWLTKDRVPVVVHDAILDRTTNGSGPLRARTLAEIKKLDAGFRFDPEGKRLYPFREKGITIPTLEEILTQFPDTHFCLEIKERKAVAVGPIHEVIQRIKRSGSLVVGSFRGDIVRALRQSVTPFADSFLAKDEVSRAYLLFRLHLKKFTPAARFASLPPKEGKIRLDGGRWYLVPQDN